MVDPGRRVDVAGWVWYTDPNSQPLASFSFCCRIVRYKTVNNPPRASSDTPTAIPAMDPKVSVEFDVDGLGYIGSSGSAVARWGWT